jgi:hypothetical protein
MRRNTANGSAGRRRTDGGDRSTAPDAGIDSGRVLDLDDEPVDEGPPPECAIDGCTRQGAAARKIRPPGSDEEPTEQYVCRRHYLLFVGIRAAVAVVILAIFLAAFFRF